MELGNPSDRHVEHRNQPVIQGIGTRYFSLLEGQPLPAVRIEIFERVELSQYSKVSKIVHVQFEDLTAVSRANLPEAVRRIVEEREKLFVTFFNTAEPVNIRIHSLELLPGVGKKLMRAILDERGKAPFTSFEDIRNRTRIDPVRAIVERIVRELMGTEKYYLFVMPPPQASGAVYLGYLERLYEEAL